MKDYQNALDELEANAVQWKANKKWNKENGFFIDDIGIDEMVAYSKLLQELVDKATPKKPYYQCMTSCLEGANFSRTAIFEISCKNCDNTLAHLDKMDYCPYCGQAIDWSNDE